MNTRHLLFALSFVTLLAAPNTALADSENRHHEGVRGRAHEHYVDRYDRDQKGDDRYGYRNDRNVGFDDRRGSHDDRIVGRYDRHDSRDSYSTDGHHEHR